MLRIACLHTAQSNIPVFDAALVELGSRFVELKHFVRADLLAAAEHAAGITPEIAEQTVTALSELCGDSDVVLLTCSTLGPAAESAALVASKPILRVDAALAREAVKQGRNIVVLCAAPTTVEPTRLLFERAAHLTGAKVIVRLVPGAWEAFRAGDGDLYLSMIAEAAADAFERGASRVALAQASMAGAVALAPVGRRPLDSPSVGLAAAAAASSRPNEGFDAP